MKSSLIGDFPYGNYTKNDVWPGFFVLGRPSFFLNKIP
jgi:hypothetical protein